MKKFFILALFLCGCSSMPNRIFSIAGEEEEQSIEASWRKQKVDLLSIQEMSDNERYQEAIEALGPYRKMYPNTPYYQASKLVEANAYRGLEQFQEALVLYEEIQAATFDLNNQLWAQARYESTFALEAVGEKIKALSILLGFEKGERYLDEDIMLAELPARVASLYLEEGREKEAQEYLSKSEKGLKYLADKKGVDSHRDWFAQTLYRMGSVITPNVTTENFSRVLQAQRKTQTYLIKAIELGAPVWSQRASETLIGKYRNYWNFIQATWGQPEDKTQRIYGYKALHTLISESLYRQPGEPELWNDSLRAYFSFANRLEQDLSTELYSPTETTLLTNKAVPAPKGIPVRLPKKNNLDIPNSDPNM